MKRNLKELLQIAPADFNGEATTPANAHLFNVNSENEQLGADQSAAYMDDWEKLRRFVQYLRSKKDLYLTLEVDEAVVAKFWIDASIQTVGANRSILKLSKKYTLLWIPKAEA